MLNILTTTNTVKNEPPPGFEFFITFMVVFAGLLLFGFVYWLAKPSAAQKSAWANQAIYRESVKQRELLEQQFQQQVKVTNKETKIDLLFKLAHLREQGHISEEEFNKLKSELVNS